MRSVGKLDDIPAIGEKGAHWVTRVHRTRATRPARSASLRSVCPPAGTRSGFGRIPSIVSWTSSFPLGKVPSSSPTFTSRRWRGLECWVKPAAEIDAVDLDGKPVTLADYRGKVTVLAFWSSKHESEFRSVSLLSKIQERFKGQPVAILVTA